MQDGDGEGHKPWFVVGEILMWDELGSTLWNVFKGSDIFDEVWSPDGEQCVILGRTKDKYRRFLAWIEL